MWLTPDLARSRRRRLTLLHSDTGFDLAAGRSGKVFAKRLRPIPIAPDSAVDEVLVNTMALRPVRDPQGLDMIGATGILPISSGTGRRRLRSAASTRGR